jgi:hypothetical protein
VQEVADIFVRCFDSSPIWLSKLIQHQVMHQCRVQAAAE